MATHPASHLAFCNQNLSVGARVEDLLPRLTLQEKISQLGHQSREILRLGIPAYNWWNEALHGVASSPGISFGGSVPCATAFPQVIGTAASFNRTLWKAIGQVISTEARAMSNMGRAGLTFWTPNVNVFRDPRWGRGQETPGEDPLLASDYAAEFVSGLQDIPQGLKTEARGSNDASRFKMTEEKEEGYLKVSACCKHMVAYDLENWEGMDRYHFDAQVSARDMEDTYLPPFRSCIERARASGVMCAYNRVDGVPACARGDLLTDMLRRDWGFHGYVTSDCGAVSIIESYTHYARTPEEAVVDTLTAGMDLNCGSYVQSHTLSAIQKGKLSVSQVDEAVSRLLSVRMRLGLFDGNLPHRPFADYGPDLVGAPAHRQLALDAARQSLVLLKNERGTLPWARHRPKNRQLSIALIGPHANASTAMLGNYAGVPCLLVTPIDAAVQSGTQVVYEAGCADVACASDAGFAAAVAAAKRADHVAVFVGLDQQEEAEGRDRISLSLPGLQERLIAEVAAACRLPVTVVVLGGGPLDMSAAKSDPRVGAILWAGYPGEAGGQAIMDALFGGRLPVTWYPKEFERVSMLDMAMRSNLTSGYPGRTYRFYTGTPVFPFGHGLSYTRFAYSSLRAYPPALRFPSSPCTVKQPDSSDLSMPYPPTEPISIEVSFSVDNVGARDGEETVLLYLTPVTPRVEGDIEKTLVGFQRLSLRRGETKDAAFKFKATIDSRGIGLASEGGESRWPVKGGRTYRLSAADKFWEFEVLQEACSGV